MKPRLHFPVTAPSSLVRARLPHPRLVVPIFFTLLALTVHIAQAAGTEAWVQRYNGPANRDDGAGAIAVDGSGNVVVTGVSYTSETAYQYYTAKYAAASGALLWEKRTSVGGVSAMVVDDRGDVIVTGGHAFIGFNGDYYTGKYSGTDGALLWEKRYNGPANGSDVSYFADSLALGPNGMVAITGYSEGILNSRTTYDFATVVYWENLPSISITADGSSGYFIRGTGTAGSIYELQRAASFTDAWLSNSTMTAAVSGVIEFHDTNAPLGRAFYRTVQR